MLNSQGESMDKQQWINEYVDQIIKITGLPPVSARQCAEVAYEDCGNDMTPIEAVKSELEHWDY